MNKNTKYAERLRSKIFLYSRKFIDLIYQIWIIIISYTLMALIINPFDKVKEAEDMAVIYATLIIKGKKTIFDVPLVIRDQVKEILIDMDLPELADDTIEK